ncbi:hypothetical protein ACFFIX_14065 [Metabacillus herbersteinensis]|uniref:Gas vesicle protein GvpU n=1 Tax=Metabacillus herbersteinensis TaxID=283816 RepID=A0ABV6GHA9_9BACI
MAKPKEPQIPVDDAIIMDLLTLVNEDDYGIEIELTLTIGGNIVSGLLISATAYYEGVIETYKKDQQSTVEKIVSKRLENLQEKYKKQKEEQKDQDKDGEENLPKFIHLKNARFNPVAGQTNSFNNSDTYWRGHVSSLDGFSFGTL